MSWRDRIAKALVGIRAYHGSPHDFERFDMKKVNTGEGSQARGHGLYFTENPEVARDYKSRLAIEANAGEGAQANTVLYYLQRNNFDKAAARADLEQNLRQALPDTHPIVSAIQAYSPGRVYEVNLNANPEHLLDWEKQVREQTPHVQDALRKFNVGEPWSTGRDVYRQMADRPGIPQSAEFWKNPGAPYTSSELRNAGVPGIRYLGNDSPISKGSSSYVMFDDSLIDIMKKYGLAGAAPPAAMGAIAAQDQYGAQP